MLPDMKTPLQTPSGSPASPDAWQRGLERIRRLSPWQRALIDPKLVEEALYGETTVIS